MVVEFQKEEPQESVFKEEESRNRDPLKAWAHVSLDILVIPLYSIGQSKGSQPSFHGRG